MWAEKYATKEVFIGRLDYNADLLEQINSFCDEKNITSGFITVLGALKKANLGFYNQQEKKYESHPVDKNVEIVNCYGNISIKDGKPFAHIHLVVSDNEGNTKAGHTMPGCIIFAGEAYIHQLEGETLVRQFDETTALPLWKKPE